MSQYLGDISAYALAVSQGYTGTEEEYAELMASYATVGQTAVTAAQTATTKALEAATSATTATNKASEAASSATTATTAAEAAQADADAAALDASQALSAASTATTKATEATTAAATATSAATTATTAKDDAVSAKTAAQTAQTGAETAAASVQSSAAQIATNAEDISQLKSDLSTYVGNHTGNLYNKNNDLLGKGITAAGEIIDNANYKLSDLIYIGPDKTFTFETKYYAGMNSGVSNIAYYDADKHFSARVSVSTDETVTITTNGYRYYIRLVMFINTPDLMCNMGNTILPYAPYGLDYCSYLSHNASKVYDFEMGGITIYGSLVENNIRARSAQIYFPNNISNPKLVFKCNAEYIFSVMVFFDEHGNYSRSFSSFIYFANKLIEVPINEGESSFIISFKKANDAEFTTEEITNIKVTCYFRDVASYEEVNIIRQNVNALQTGHWHGKKYTALGDSITYGFIPRNYTGYPGQLDSYAKLTAEALGMTFDNQGISGSTMAYVDGRSPMSRRYSSLPNDADLITVMGGTNDIRNGVPLGTMNDRTDATFYGALHVVLGGLYKKYFIDQGVSEGKEKKIVVCTPIKLLSASAETQGGTGTLVDMSAWVEAVKEVAAYYSLPVLDFYNLSGINPHLNETIQGTEQGYTGFYNPYITDGTHPTKEGQQMMADVLCGFLKSLM